MWRLADTCTKEYSIAVSYAKETSSMLKKEGDQQYAEERRRLAC